MQIITVTTLIILLVGLCISCAEKVQPLTDDPIQFQSTLYRGSEAYDNETGERFSHRSYDHYVYLHESDASMCRVLQLVQKYADTVAYDLPIEHVIVYKYRLSHYGRRSEPNYSDNEILYTFIFSEQNTKNQITDNRITDVRKGSDWKNRQYYAVDTSSTKDICKRIKRLK
jgi:hypothetical protein